MKTRTLLTTTSAAAMLFLAGCAAPPSQPIGAQSYPSSSYPSSSYPSSQQSVSSYGVIDGIDAVSASNNGIGVGSVVGALGGAVLGNQVGSGRGRTAATVAGAVGGAVVGNQVEQRNKRDSYNVRVRLDNGTFQTVTQDNVADLRVGNRVRIENGRVYRY